MEAKIGTSVWDQSTTAASNTSIGGVNQGEGCAPSTLNNATRALAAQMKGALIGVTASGTDTYTATLAPAPDALTDGMTVHIRFTNANATTTPTLNINSLGAETIVKEGSAALVAGDIPAGHEGDLRYNGTNWVLLNPKTGSNAVLTSRSVISGAGLTGGGDLSADRTLAVGAGTGIVANADDVAIDKAAQVDGEAQTSNKVLTADNAKYHPGVAKAWGVFAGATGTASVVKGCTVSRSTTGTYPVAFSANLTGNYAISISMTSSGFVRFSSLSASGFTIETRSTGDSATDPTTVTFSVFGTLA